MDANKLKKLKDVIYIIDPCCAFCKHSNFNVGNFGTCNKHSYTHAKHTGPDRQLSINRYGRCVWIEVDVDKRKAVLQNFNEYF